MKRWEFERAVLASGLSAPVRHVLLTLAVFADWPGGTTPAAHTPSLSRQADATGLGRSTVARALAEAEGTGWLARARPPVEKARSEKARTRYRLQMPTSPTAGLVPERDQNSPTAGLELVPERDTSQTFTRPSQQQAQPSTQWRDQVLAEIRRRRPDASDALIRHIYQQDGQAILAELREQAARQELAAWIANLRRLPPCEHGDPGGDQLRPDTHRPQCALCRAGKAAA